MQKGHILNMSIWILEIVYPVVNRLHNVHYFEIQLKQTLHLWSYCKNIIFEIKLNVQLI